MIDNVRFGSKKIDYQVVYTDRKTLGITVKPDLSVWVKAPRESSKKVIKDKLKKKAPWVIKQQNFFKSFQPRITERLYVSGETHLYLGRQYRLKVKISTSESVKLLGRYLEVNTSNKSHTSELVISWYLSHARTKLIQIAKPIIERFEKYNVRPTSIAFQEMPTRWGSCSQKGKILLNPELIKAPKACIEYVIIHELCHLIHHDHTQKFLDLQTKEMPDWEKWKLKLENMLA